MRPLLLALAATLTLPTLASAQLGGIGGIGGTGGLGPMGGTGGIRIGTRGPGAGGGRGGMPGGARPGGRPQAPEFAKAKELEHLNIAALLLDDARKLHLTDEQKTQLTALRDTIHVRNADLIARYDSIRRNFHPPKPDERAAMRGGRRGPDGTGGEGAGTRGSVGEDGVVEVTDPERAVRDTAFQQMREMIAITQQLITRRERDAAEALALVSDADRPRARDRIDAQTQQLREQLPRGLDHGRDRDGRGRGREADRGSAR